MFVGLTFMVGGHMACGVIGDDLMVRMAGERAAAALDEDHVRPMDFTGRPMRGYVFVSAAGCATDATLKHWVSASLELVATLPAKKPKKRKPPRSRN